MSINLPPIIKAIDDIAQPPAKPEYDAKLDLGLKKIVIVITKDIPEEDMKTLKEYGKVLEYDNRIHANMPIDSYRWDYLIFDVRESGDRYELMRSVIPFKDKYKIIVYSYFFEKDEVIPEADNHLSSFPKIQAKREDYEALLLQKRLSKPRWWVSLFQCILGVYNGIKK
ncbi:hypothetical protein EB001_14405 [bacterium]|nr:hypothetical protein [bacterium]